MLLILLIIPSTRTEVASFFIRLTSMPPSSLESEHQFIISDKTKAWQINDINGDPVSFESMNNKPVFLNFWATWCPPCIAELPGIEDLYKEYGDKVNFILVSEESRAKVRAFAKKNKYDNLPFYQNNYVPIDFASQSIPTTFILSSEGKVVVSEKGVAKWNSNRIKKILDDLIAGN
jgi:thiol-disulfide isomerase/thioredoxin